MRVECGSASRFEFFRGQQLLETPAVRLPTLIRVPGKDLRQSSPAYIACEQPLVVVRRSAVLRIEPLDQLDRGEVVAALLLERAAPDTILISNPVITRI